MNYTGKVAVALVLTALLSACGSTPDNGQAVTSAINTGDAVKNAQNIYQNWQEKIQSIEHLQLYSPNKYDVVQAHWKKADSIYQSFAGSPETAFKSYSIFSSATYLERFLDEINQAQITLTKLDKLKVKSDRVLAPAIKQMAYLNSLDAARYYRSEYTRLNRFYAKLFNYIDNDDVSDAREEQEEFLERSFSLEIKTVKKIYIAPLETKLRDLRRNDVRYYAPLSYSRVETEITDGNRIIDLTPRNFKAIDKKVIEIQFELDHAAHIALEVKGLRDRSKDDYENFILEIENKLLRISRALDNQDLRNQPIRSQAKLITEGVLSARKSNFIQTQPYYADDKNNDTSIEQVTALTKLVEAQKQQIQQLRLEAKPAPSIDESVATQQNGNAELEIPINAAKNAEVEISE
ncbi:hypothetical protein C9J12_11120 [Photobacterium frigidiphilum]|uniref:DNA repair protein n=1 Tax=Photobacterium frigidiphilum TaxID=264736 RepID=A0A2T3JHZ5_9GAMM|nr:hypothetical protein [Photobacterium frigidiphilum]PSU48597.1 hypothetical protein C9J12_11120 [Photobacterium frigidiphilum]